MDAVREHLIYRIAINLRYVPPFKQWREFVVLSFILTVSIMTQFFCSADLPMILEDRVAAVGIATQFQEHSNQVFKMVENMQRPRNHAAITCPVNWPSIRKNLGVLRNKNLGNE